MKKITIILIILMLCSAAFAQRLTVRTYADPLTYKKHYSHNIEAAYVEGRFYDYIAGNITDLGVNSEFVSGHKLDGMTPVVNKLFYLASERYNIHFTDFTIDPGLGFDLAAGTGVYYPDGVDGAGYPFLAIYDRNAGQVISFRYYHLTYPDPGPIPAQAAGLRVKYSERTGFFYICGVMCDRKFSDIDFNNMNVKTRGFILKIEPDNQLVPVARIFVPDAVEDQTWLSLVGDFEFNSDETALTFTGINTKDRFRSCQQPMTGMMDMDLNLAWCYVYDLGERRYTGVDVIFDEQEETLFVLHNSTESRFAVMQLAAADGMIVQNAQTYNFTDPSTTNDITRAHMMHLDGERLIITGNHFAKENTSIAPRNYQYLYKFELNPADLSQPLTLMTHYSQQEEPPGLQKQVYPYWVPENSVYEEGNLQLVGVYNNNFTYFGFTYVNVGGIDPACVVPFEETLWQPNEVREWLPCEAIEESPEFTADEVVSADIEVVTHLDCDPYSFKQGSVESGDEMMHVSSITSEGIAIVINSEQPAAYRLQVCDLLGRPVSSITIDAEAGLTHAFIPAELTRQVYLVRITDGINTETIKIINLR